MAVKVRVVTIDLTAISSLMDDEVVELKHFNEKCIIEHATDGELSTALDFYAGDAGVKHQYCHIGNDIAILGGEDQIIQYIKLP